MIDGANFQLVNWAANNSKSNICFKARYLLFGIDGCLENFNIKVETRGEDFSTAEIAFTAQLDSLDTENPSRDASVREYLDNHHWAKDIKFNSTFVEKISEHSFLVNGSLTALSVSRPLQLKMQFGGLHRAPGDNLSADFTLNGKIDYLDFLPADSKLHSLSFALSKTIDITVEAHLVKPVD